jgi:hypothetical protein
MHYIILYKNDLTTCVLFGGRYTEKKKPKLCPVERHPCRGLGHPPFADDTITPPPNRLPRSSRLGRVPAPVTLQDMGQGAFKSRPPGWCRSASQRHYITCVAATLPTCNSASIVRPLRLNHGRVQRTVVIVYPKPLYLMDRD